MSSSLGWWRDRCWSDGAALWCRQSCDNWTHPGLACSIVGRDHHPANYARPCTPSSGPVPRLSTPSAVHEQWHQLESWLWAVSSSWTRHTREACQASIFEVGAPLLDSSYCEQFVFWCETRCCSSFLFNGVFSSFIYATHLIINSGCLWTFPSVTYWISAHN